MYADFVETLLPNKELFFEQFNNLHYPNLANLKPTEAVPTKVNELLYKQDYKKSVIISNKTLFAN